MSEAVAATSCNLRAFDGYRFPARMLSRYKVGAAKIWLWMRGTDHQTGTGKVEFHLWDAAHDLARDEKTIRRWLRQAKQQGLVRAWSTTKGICTCYYVSLKRVAKELKDLGGIASISLEQLRNLSITATEIEAQRLQQQSFYSARQEEKNKGNKHPQIHEPERVVGNTYGKLAWVLFSNSRFVFVSEGFIDYGGSQAQIALRRGCSLRTVQRHLDNGYRLTPSPVHGYRDDLAPICKKQIAQRLPRRFNNMVKVVRASGDPELQKDIQRLIECNGRVWEMRCNLYALDYDLLPARYRRKDAAAMVP